jgi:hypothetical protein
MMSDNWWRLAGTICILAVIFLSIWNIFDAVTKGSVSVASYVFAQMSILILSFCLSLYNR